MINSIGKFIFSLGLVISSVFGHQTPSQPVNVSLGANLPQGVAVFQTSLLSQITSSASSMTLVANSVRGNSTLAGFQCFTLDEGQSIAEYICGTVSGTSVTSLVRGIDPLTGTTTNSALQFAHRRGAEVKVTDFPVIQIMRNQLSGTESIPSVLFYATHPTFTSNTQLVDLQQLNATAFGSVPVIVASGGTGNTSNPLNMLLVGNGVNAITSTSSPTVGYITATSTTIASNFAGNVNVAGNLNITGNLTGATSNSIVVAYQASEPITSGDVVSIGSMGSTTLDKSAKTSTITASSTYLSLVTNPVNAMLVVSCAGNDTGHHTVYTMQYASTSMTKATGYKDGNYDVEIWYLMAPTTGTNNIFIGWGAAPSDSHACVAGSYNNVDQTPGDIVTATGESNGATFVATTTIDKASTIQFTAFNDQGANGGIVGSASSTLVGFQARTGMFNSSFMNNARGFSQLGGTGSADTYMTASLVIPSFTQYSGIYRTSAYYSGNATSTIGVARTSIAQGAIGNVTLGGIATGFSGLSVGSIYYLGNATSSVSITAGNNSVKMGTADSTTTLDTFLQ